MLITGTSPKLFSTINNIGTNTCCTARKNWKNMPSLLEKLRRNELGAKYTSENKIKAIKWYYNRDVYTLRTMHVLNFQATSKWDHRTGREVLKSNTVLEYKMWAVDKTNILLKIIKIYDIYITVIHLT